MRSLAHLLARMEALESGLSQHLDQVEGNLMDKLGHVERKVNGVEARVTKVESNLTGQCDILKQRVSACEANVMEKASSIDAFEARARAAQPWLAAG